MALIRWVIALGMGIILALFSVQNQQVVSVNLLGVNYPGVPAWVIVIGSAALGASMVFVISIVDRVRWWVQSRQNKRVLTEHKRMVVERDNRIFELEQELFRLRGAA